MTFQLLVFYLFSAVLIASAVSMVTARNPVYSALFLILCFFTSSALWILMEAEFLGVVLILVYVGAVMVLFLFVIMMLDINLDVLREGFTRYLPVGALVAVVVAAEMSIVLSSDYFDMPVPEPALADHNNTKALGEVLYTQYVYPFEIAAVILLVAIIAAITLTMRHRPDTKYQDPAAQIRVKREDRVRLVSGMTAAKSEPTIKPKPPVMSDTEHEAMLDESTKNPSIGEPKA